MELFIRLILFLQGLIYQILRPHFWYINRRPGQKIPPIKNQILNLSAVVIADKIRKQELSSESVVTAYVERIRDVNPILNASIDDRFEAAIEDAKDCDKKLAAGDLTAKQLELEQPLFGVPITVKESIAVKDMSFTGGSVARVGVKANYNGEVVVALKNAGAIPLCVTNTPELCLGFESTNHLFGTTNNPYDTRRTAGGSSGGEGALISSSASLIGIGSDLAGSIRVPAHINGIFGHKPTAGIVSIDGHFPNTDDANFRKILVLGPMTRYAEDLELAFKVLTKKHSESLRLDTPVAVKSLKIRYMEEVEKSFGLISVKEEVKFKIRKAANYLQGIGADVKKVNINEMKNSMEVGLAGIFDISNMCQLLLNPEDPKHENNASAEIIKSIFGLSRHTKSAIFFKFSQETKGFIPQSRMPFHRKEAKKLRQIFADMLGTDGVFLYPTFTSSAPFHNELSLKQAGTMYCLIFNTLGFPSTTVPMGLDGDGLPIGIQVVACPMQDRLCLAVAKELEKGFGGWTPPPTTTTV